MKVSSVMTPNPETGRPKDDLAQAAMVMWRRDCGFVPIVDDASKRVVGVITDRDICMATSTKHAAPEALKVEDAMSATAWTCNGDDEIEDALETMRTHQVHRLPVLDRADRLAGILSYSDVVRHATADGKIRSIGDHDLIATYRTITQPRTAETVGAARVERTGGEVREV